MKATPAFWILLGAVVLGHLAQPHASPPCSLLAAESALAPAPASQPAKAAVPRLVELGADKCVPCKMMAPILEELKKDYAGRLEVEFIDVWKNPEAARKYAVQIIPTQVFFDATGKEKFRHQGFFSKADILAKWKELGIDLNQSQQP